MSASWTAVWQTIALAGTGAALVFVGMLLGSYLTQQGVKAAGRKDGDG